MINSHEKNLIENDLGLINSYRFTHFVTGFLANIKGSHSTRIYLQLIISKLIKHNTKNFFHLSRQQFRPDCFLFNFIRLFILFFHRGSFQESFSDCVIGNFFCAFDELETFDDRLIEKARNNFWSFFVEVSMISVKC